MATEFRKKHIGAKVTPTGSRPDQSSVTDTSALNATHGNALGCAAFRQARDPLRCYRMRYQITRFNGCSERGAWSVVCSGTTDYRRLRSSRRCGADRSVSALIGCGIGSERGAVGGPSRIANDSGGLVMAALTRLDGVGTQWRGSRNASCTNGPNIGYWARD